MCLLELLALCHYSENQVDYFVLIQFKMNFFKNLPILIFKAGLISTAATTNNSLFVLVLDFLVISN